MPTHISLCQNAKFATRNDIGRWEKLFGIIKNRDFQIVMLFCLLGLVADHRSHNLFSEPWRRDRGIQSILMLALVARGKRMPPRAM
jgi:hypothetical protein